MSNDELALFLFRGGQSTETKRPLELVTLPCVDERGQTALIAGILVQFGKKKVSCNGGDGFKVDAGDTAMIALTFKKEDWIDQWGDVSENPFKFSSLSNSLHALEVGWFSTWGRSCRKGKNITGQDDCTSDQIHALTKADNLVPLLRAAGRAAPKLSSGKPDSEWKFIWLGATTVFRPATLANAKNCRHCRFMKRVALLSASKSQYGNAWQALYPGVQQPRVIDATSVWKVESLPFGVTSSMMMERASH